MSKIFENAPHPVTIHDYDEVISAYPITEAPMLGRAMMILGKNHPYDMRRDSERFRIPTWQDLIEMRRLADSRAGLWPALREEGFVSTTFTDEVGTSSLAVPALIVIGSTAAFGFRSGYSDTLPTDEAQRSLREAIEEQLYGGMYCAYTHHPVSVS